MPKKRLGELMVERGLATPEQVRRRVAIMQRCYEISNIPFPEGARLNGERLREAQPAEKDY